MLLRVRDDDDVRALHEMYVEDNLSTYDLERLCTWSHDQIAYAFKRLGLPLRVGNADGGRRAGYFARPAEPREPARPVPAPRGPRLGTPSDGKRRRGWRGTIAR